MTVRDGTSAYLAAYNKLSDDNPDVVIRRAVPPLGFYDPVDSTLWIYPDRSVQDAKNLLIDRRYYVEAMLPCDAGGDLTESNMVDPVEIQEWVGQIIESLRNIQVSNDYISFRLVSVAWMNDPYGQKSRARLEFSSLDESYWY